MVKYACRVPWYATPVMRQKLQNEQQNGSKNDDDIYFFGVNA